MARPQLAGDMPQRQGYTMQKPSKEMLGATALVLVIVAAGHLWAGAADACVFAQNEFATEIKKANGCVDYWLNRYQTAWAGLLGTAALIFTARLAWLGVMSQVAGQRHANALAEFAFWTQVYRQDSEALDTCEIALNLVRKIEVRLSASPAVPRPYRKVMEKLRADGLVPFELVPTTAAEAIAFKLNRHLKKANEYWRFGKRIGAASDNNLGNALHEIVGMIAPFEAHKSQVLKSLLDADLRLRAVERSRR